MSLKVVLFGDCVIQQSCQHLEHCAAFGLTSWLSISSPITENFKKMNEIISKGEGDFTDYERRIWRYNTNKDLFKYLFKDQGDYFIFDCNDNRKEILIDKSSKELSVITPNLYMKGSDYIINKIYKDKESYIVKQCYEIDFSYFEKTVDIVCGEILRHYVPDRIIYIKHRAVEYYYDELGLHKFFSHSKDEFLNEETLDYWNRIEDLVLKKMQGVHLIDFPENVVVDKNHLFGLNPLHYQSLYNDYIKNALEIIFDKFDYKTERKLLIQLKEIYTAKFTIFFKDLKNSFLLKKMNQEIQVLCKSLDLLPSNIQRDYINYVSSINDFDVYLDYLYRIKNYVMILVAVKDTAGFYNNSISLEKIRRLGFISYPQKLWSTYIGFSLNGKIIIDISSFGNESDDNNTLTNSIDLPNLSISLLSSSYISLNEARIVVNGIDYCKNNRGINMVVLNSLDNEFVDSICFDSHLNDYFTR